ncbi:MAG: Ig-like domain-containing protein, partial [Planctomycetota bacterium]
MANRKSHSAYSSSNSTDNNASKQAAQRRLRGLLLESLEERRLLAVGPQLIGIQPNNSDLLVDQAVRNQSPRELTFRFDDDQVIDSNTLDGIRLTRSGGDGTFGLPTATSDIGTGGKVELQLTSSDNDVLLTVDVAGVDLGDGAAPTFAVAGDRVTIVLNTNTNTPTTAQGLVDAIGNASELEGVLTARINGGFPDTPLNAGSGLSVQLSETGDQFVTPGFAVVGQAPNENEVTLRFGEALPNDLYRIEVFGFDDPIQGITGLRNTVGEIFHPTNSNTRKDTVDFHLDLGPQVTSVVPQPVVRGTSGLEQQRDRVVVYFDSDKMLVENDAGGNPTARSVENPEFYQLIFTHDTVRNTDDNADNGRFRFNPTEVIYNAVTNSATLRFERDIHDLPTGDVGDRTFRLRIGTRESAPIAPDVSFASATTISDFNTGGAARFRFTAKELGEDSNGLEIAVTNSGNGVIDITANGDTINVDLGSDTVTAGELLTALQTASASTSRVAIQLEPGSDENVVLNAPINYSPIQVVGLGSSFDTAGDLGVIGSDVVDQTSLILTSDIDAVPFAADLVGANDDPGHRLLPSTGSFAEHLNERFGADSVDGITTISYNFQTIYERDSGGNPLTNAITEKQKDRAREALEIWSNHLGIQFVETPSEGITIATGALSSVPPGPGVVVQNNISTAVRIDPDFEDSLLVLEAVRQWGDNYGEDYFRASLTGMGMLLGLEEANDQPVGTLLRLDTAFVNAGSLNNVGAHEPIFPGVVDVLHGEHQFRNDSNDIDLYRFQVDLGEERSGLFVAETFAERLVNSSNLDTLLHLYQQRQAYAESNFAAGAGLNVRFDALAPGRLGNNLQIFVTKSDRGVAAPVLVNVFENLISIDLNSHAGSETTAQQVVDAINDNTDAASLVRASVQAGDANTKVGDREITYSPITLNDGDVELIARNDDYASEDSKIELNLGSGTYYIGVTSTGNDAYDPVIEDTGIGGTTQGKYDLRVTYRAQVDSQDALSDTSGVYEGDESVVFDGDADGIAGGVYNFWFQTRPLNRVLSFNAGGSPSLEGNIVELTGTNGTTRRFEFTTSGSVGIGNTAIFFNASSNAGTLAQALANAINSRPELGIDAVANGTEIELTGDRSVALTPGLTHIDIEGRMIFVDKSAGVNADGSLGSPFNNISGNGVPNAFDAAQPGDIVRIIGNGGGDNNITTLDDNFAYEFGFSLLNGAPLSDGVHMEVPKGVTTMVDAGAIFKMRRSRVGVGSSNLGIDRSGGVLQVLGTPYLTNQEGGFLLDPTGDRVAGSVYFTSWLDETIGEDTYLPETNPRAGDWGGLSYRNDVDSAAGRRNMEDEGIFLQYVNHADIRYGGGGNVVVDSVQQVVNPIQMIDVRPTVTFNTISNSADAAMSAAPDSFEETNFHEPRFQLGGLFTSDYDRVGPEIHHNQLIENSLNGLFIRVETPAGQSIRPLTVSARFDDIDITHIVAENIIVTGTPGGPLLDVTRPLANLVSLEPIAGGDLLPGTYSYKVSYVDQFGYETPPSDASFSVTLNPGEDAIRLRGLPRATGEFVGRRLYRSDASGGGLFERVAELDADATEFLDTGLSAGGFLHRDRADVSNVIAVPSSSNGSLSGVYNYRIVMVNEALEESLASDPTADVDTDINVDAVITLSDLPRVQEGFVAARIYRSAVGGEGPYILAGSYGPNDTFFVDDGTDLGITLSSFLEGTFRPRTDASLVIDPGTVVKLEGARIELQQGTTLLAEGTDGAGVVFTSKLDDRYGGSGSFDTNNDDTTTSPAARDWGGIYAGSGATLSLDHAVFAYAGGVVPIEGTFKAFSPIELQQANARIANSHFEFNEDGIGGQGPTNRLGRLHTLPSTIFIRGAQPIILDNVFENNQGSALTIDANSINADLLRDFGRSTGLIDRDNSYDTNRGPLIRDNRFDNNELNGLEVRGDELMVESVWDDTDIVHVLFNTIIVSNLHHEGGLRLQSSPSESLVVKLLGYGANHNTSAGTGFNATGFHTNANDRVGGTVEIIGQPGFPVVLTSFHDDTVGAGLQPDGTPQTDTNNNGIGSTPRPADWRSVLLDQYSNDRNVDRVLEIEAATAIAPGFNSTSDTAQVLGDLAGDPSNSDENNLRHGFSVQGALSEPTDVDVYSFTAEAGTEIWIDVDDTTHSLDMMIELLNADGDLLARSDNSSDETLNSSLITRTAGIIPTLVNPLNEAVGDFRTNASGTFKEYGSTNPRDAGLRVLLPGSPGARTTFHFRVRSASTNPENFNAGLTSGVYEVQVRTRAEQDFPGSTVQYADIRYATNGIHLEGLPGHSPLLGEVGENESRAGATYANNDVNAFENEFNPNPLIATPGARDQYIGNILEQDRATTSIAGELSDRTDLDFYRFDVSYVNAAGNGLANLVFDMDYADGLNRANTNLSVFRVNAGFGGQPAYQLVLFGEASNIADDIRGPLSFTDIDDLSRGSVGSDDPFIGSVQLPEGQYAVAVSAASQVPSSLNGATRIPLYSLFSNSSVTIPNGGGEGVLDLDLGGYSALDLPRLYLTGGGFAGGQVFIRESDGTETFLGGFAGAQSSIDLDDFAGQNDLELVFRSGTGQTVTGISVGFAERGEAIAGAGFGTTFTNQAVPPNTIESGAYQLEIRQAQDTISDTNDRAANQITLIAPSGAALVDGDVFTLTDAGNAITFEFTSDQFVTPGNVPVQFTDTSSAAEVATAIRDAVNDSGVQSRLNVQASGAGGEELTPVTDARVHLFGRAAGEFGKVGVQYHNGDSDRNTNRDQGQVLIQNNFIRHSRDYGVWTTHGERLFDPRDSINAIWPQHLNSMSNRPAMQNSAPGAVRNLRELNDDLLGGFTPGIIVQNNVLESGGLGGVHVASEHPIWMISAAFIPGWRDDIAAQGDHSTGADAAAPDHFGTFIPDGLGVNISTERNSVSFEFEDMSLPAAGGGDGYADTNVPIWYRTDGGAVYLRTGATPTGFSALETMQAIRDAIHGSVLTTNGTTQTVKATVAPSFLPEAPFNPGVEPFGGYINYFNNPAVYIENISSFSFNSPNHPFDVRRVDASSTPQWFARVINNTIYGSDGRASLDGPEVDADEPNDLLSDAVQTWQGTGHNQTAYTTTGTIGGGDVDIYQFKLDIGERLRADIDTGNANSILDSVLQVFDASGIRQPLIDAAGDTVDFIDNAAAPGESLGLDPYVDFTATKPGVYYLAVSANGNIDFDPLSFANRQMTDTTGAYALDLEVLHPQHFAITVQDPSAYPAGSTFRIYQIPDQGGGVNFRDFEFVNGGGGATQGRVPVNVDYANYRVSDVARAIAGAINASGLNNAQGLPNGDFGVANPLDPVSAVALGGMDGVEGLQLFPRRPDGVLPTHSGLGIGHDRTASGRISGTADGAGTQERYVVVNNAAWIDGMGTLQVAADLNADSNLDQILPENGVMVSGGSSPTILNNVFVNTQTPIWHEGGIKPGEVIIGGSIYQYTEGAATNVPGTGLDFNITLPSDHRTFVNAQASQFLPAEGSRIIDSSVDSLEEREAFRTIKQAVGIAVSPMLAPSRDSTGQLRIDDPDVAPPNGQGADVFKDRGALDRADFVGPSAEALRPLDNDSRGVDSDSTISVIQLTSGVYPEFRVQLVDGFEVSDPFPGIGIDDATVIGPHTESRRPGAAVTLFEDGRLLEESIDYRFTFNTTTNELIFTPLAGVWRTGAVYEVAINNRDRFVILAPSGDAFADGDSFTMTDTQGGVVFFELDSGYQIQVPQGLTLEIPLAGAAAGGVADGDRFSVKIGTDETTFEFDRNNNSLDGNLPISFQYADSQQEILDAVEDAIAASGLPVVTKVIGQGQLFLGATPGTELDTNFTTMAQPATTQAVRIPELGPRPGGVVEGQTFELSDGTNTVIFEYDTNGTVAAGNAAIDISTALIATDVANATMNALLASSLNIAPTFVDPLLIHLGLSSNGFVDVGTSGLTAVGVARSVSDGETFEVSTLLGTETYEFDSDNSVTDGNVAIPFAVTDTEGEIGERIAQAIIDSALGLNPVHVGGGNVAIGGTTDDVVTVGNSALALFGVPGVLPGTRLNVFGPLLLSVPFSGGAAIPENATFVLTANNITQVFEFDSDFSGPSGPGNIVIDFDGLTTQNDLALSIAAAINGSPLGITATNQGGGVLSLGSLQASDVVLNDSQLSISRGVVSDGEIFTISDGLQSVTFEFENAELSNGFQLGNVPILFNSASTTATVVESMRAAIESAGLGLVPEVLQDGVLQLNDTPRFTTDVAGAPTLVVTGVPGGANAVNFIRHPSFSGEQMKQAIIRAINEAKNTNLVGADRGGNSLFVENTFAVSSELSSYFLRGVSDLAGNLLRPNRINNETQFTILMPGVTLDYGDAPDPFTTTTGRYPTQHVNDGARHVVTSSTLLGSTISAELDGQPTPLADGDVDDGVVFGTNLNTPGVFNRNIMTSIEVTLNNPGFVDAWIDFNADGDWTDPGEQILTSQRFDVSELTQVFQVTVPSTAPIPDSATTTFARFRSSSTGGLIPTGLATGGEVEDYAVTIVPGDPPVAVDDTYRVNEDALISTTDPDGQSSPNFPSDDGIAANDTDPNSGPLAVTVLEPPQHASVFTINSDGTFEYQADPHFNGTDSFTYKVNDGVLSSNNIGTVVITVVEINDAPVAEDDVLTINEDEILDISESVLLDNDSPGPANSEDGQTITITSVDPVSTRGGTVSVSNGRVRYTPPSDFSGFDTFKYTITDNGTTDGGNRPTLRRSVFDRYTYCLFDRILYHP